MQSTLTVEALYTPEHTLAAPLLRSVVYPWEALAGIRECIRALGAALSPEEYDSPRPGVWIHKTAHVFDSAYIGEDVIIGPGTEVRHGAFIRGSALVGARRGGRQLHRTEERHPVRQSAGPPLQLCRGFDPGVPFPYGSGIYYLQCQKR